MTFFQLYFTSAVVRMGFVEGFLDAGWLASEGTPADLASRLLRWSAPVVDFEHLFVNAIISMSRINLSGGESRVAGLFTQNSRSVI